MSSSLGATEEQIDVARRESHLTGLAADWCWPRAPC